jgi:hypothetical protein
VPELPEGLNHVVCPTCRSAVLVDPSAIALHCDHCGHDFFIESSSENELAASEAPTTNEAELDAARIRQRMTMVRSAYRSRSYAIIAMIVCVVLVIQSILFALPRLRARSLPLAFLYLLFALIGVAGTIYFFRKAIALHREARQSLLDQPTARPDFSDLGDGSERVRNLENIR